ncbi:MAG: hypothetical protein ACREUA_07650, partial [Burkholderiales bacterium]
TSVVFRPWLSEAHVLSAHLVENEQRGDMTFWDKSNAVFALKEMLETESGQALTLRQLEDALKQAGLAASRSALSRYQFARQKLSPLGSAAAHLVEPDIRKIQPHFNLLRRYAHEHSTITEEQLYADVLNPILLRHGEHFDETGVFDCGRLCAESEEALAAYVGRSPEQLRAAMRQFAEPSRENVEPESDSTQPVQDSCIRDESRASGTQRGKAASRAFIATPEPPLAENEIGADQALAQRPTTPAQSPEQDLLDQIEETVNQFARSCDIADCLRCCPDMPGGFYMELPGAPLDMGNANPLRHPGWWLLALISKQMDASLTHRLPPDSRWCRARRADARAADDDDLGVLIETQLLGPISPNYLADWLLDPANEPASLYLSTLQLMRGLWRVAPQRFTAPTMETTP